MVSIHYTSLSEYDSTENCGEIIGALVIKDGIAIYSHAFHQNSCFQSNLLLVSGFIDAMQSFSKEVTGKAIKSINFGNLIFHFLKDEVYQNLIFLFIGNENYNPEINMCKLLKFSSTFRDHYSDQLEDFNGSVTVFNEFSLIITDLQLSTPYCGNIQKCLECMLRLDRNKLEIKNNLNQIKGKKIKKILKYLVDEYNEIEFSLVFDKNGLIISTDPRKFYQFVPFSVFFEIIISLKQKMLNTNSSAIFSKGIVNLKSNNISYFRCNVLGKNDFCFIVLASNNVTSKALTLLTIIFAETIKNCLISNEKIEFPPILLKSDKLILKDNFTKPIIGNVILKNILIIGNEKCGKTSLINRFLRKDFKKNYIPTIGMQIQEENLNLSKDKEASFHIMEIAGSQYFTQYRNQFLHIFPIDMAFILIDLSQTSEFNTAIELIEQLLFLLNDRKKLYLIGTKSDNELEKTRKKLISLSEKYCINTMFTSAKDGYGIDDLFINSLVY